MDLRVDVAVGAVNLMRVVGAAQDSGGPVSVSPEGKPKPKEVCGASASHSDPSEDRVAVKTAGRRP